MTQPQIEITFTFFQTANEPIPNHTRTEIRREVANVFQNSEFGVVEEFGDDKFVNRFAVPLTDNYFEPENELFMSFVFAYPFAHGNFGALVSENIPRMYEILQTNERFRGMHLISRIIMNN